MSESFIRHQKADHLDKLKRCKALFQHSDPETHKYRASDLRALPNEIKEPDRAPLESKFYNGVFASSKVKTYPIPPVAATSKILLRFNIW